MQYTCTNTIKVKGFLGIKFPKFLKGESISIDRYHKLPDELKKYFVVNFEDESVGEQIERNIENDKS